MILVILVDMKMVVEGVKSSLFVVVLVWCYGVDMFVIE